MIEQNFAEVTTIGEMICEVDFAAERNMPTELVPSRQSHLDRLLEGLHHEVISVTFTVGRNGLYSVQGIQCTNLHLRSRQSNVFLVKFVCDLFNRCTLSRVRLGQFA